MPKPDKKLERAEYMKQWIAKNKEQFKLARQRVRAKLKIDVLRAYSGGQIICKCCGENDIRFLCIDHIDENGGHERRKLNKRGYNFYYYLRNENYPDNNYQVLCHNCNAGKRMYAGVCPHNLPINDDKIFESLL